MELKRERRALKTRTRTLTHEEWQKVHGHGLPYEKSEHVDYVIVYKDPDGEDYHRDEKEKVEGNRARQLFFEEMKKEGLEWASEIHDGEVYLKVMAPLWRLCRQAERDRIELPLENVS